MPKPTPHQNKYKDKMLKTGYSRITVWVPKPCKEELMGIINEMRGEHEAEIARTHQTDE